jgi:cell division protein FtsN
VDAFDISEIVLAVIIVLVMTGMAATLPRAQPVEASDTEPEVETGLDPPPHEGSAAQFARRKSDGEISL